MHRTQGYSTVSGIAVPCGGQTIAACQPGKTECWPPLQTGPTLKAVYRECLPASGGRGGDSVAR